MAGSQSGARKAVKTKLERYGKNIFIENGRKGGNARNASDKRFTPFSDPDFASKMGKRGSSKRWDKKS
jgi:hypothetical protein